MLKKSIYYKHSGFTPLEKDPSVETGLKEENKLFAPFRSCKFLTRLGKGTKPHSNFLTGFTLIEIVFALAILLIGLVGVLALFPVGLTASKKAGDYTTAALVGEQVIANIRRAGFDVYPAGWVWPGAVTEIGRPIPGFIYVDGLDADTGTTADNLPEGFSWAAAVTLTTITNLYRVTLTVYRVDQQATDGYRMEDFVTYLAKYN